MRTEGLEVVTIDFESPNLLEELEDPAGLAWVHHGEGLVAWGEAARIDIQQGAGRFERATGVLNEMFSTFDVEDEVGVPGSGPVAFGAFTFDPHEAGSVLVVPSIIIGRSNGRSWITRIGRETKIDKNEAPQDDRIRYWGSSAPEVAWLDAVATAEKAVREGELEKVVLARDMRVWSNSTLSPRRLVKRLAQRFPECYAFSVDGLIGATPELLVRTEGRHVSSLILAGSIRRGNDEAEDDALGRQLLDSTKDTVEHEIAVRSVTELWPQFCETVTMTSSPRLLKLANVQHLATEIQGGMRQDHSALEIAGALHPTAAVCGLPRDKAMDMIRRLEGMSRARYAGPVGWVDAQGNGEWGIALRCAELEGGNARLFAGGGIVAGSTPEGELDETRIKLLAMQSALG
ncbi:MAG: isochorismate synthase [Actinomycetota bacterium]